jgi:hypothetical protein
MLRSSDTWIASGGTPRSCSAATPKRIITSGPQSIATVSSGSKSARGTSVVTTPTRPRQPATAWSTATSTWTSKRPRQLSSSAV